MSEALNAAFGRVPFAAAFLRSTTVAALAVLVASCAGPVAERSDGPILAASSGPPPAYKIGPQDVLDISVFNVPEMNRTVQVSDAGTIIFPLVGDISTSG